MRFKRHVGQGYGSFWRGIIFDREYKNLDDLVTKSKRWFPLFNDGARFLESKGDYKWSWPSGEELLFRTYKEDNDYWKYHGHEYPFIGVNEITKYPTSNILDSMSSCNRSSFTWEKDGPVDAKTGERQYIPPIPLEMFITSNPFGPGHMWVKQRFIDVAPYGQLVTSTVNVFNPKTQQKEPVELTQIAIFGSYRENPYLDPQYIATLDAIKDPNKRKAWLLGSWDIVSGGVFEDLWSPAVHIKRRFRVPTNWRLDRAMDWGSSQPFSVGWWAEANGEEVLLEDGSKWCPARGSLIQVAEWYGTEKIGSNIGLRMSAADVAKGIKEFETRMVELGWFGKRPYSGPADNSIRNVVDEGTKTIEQTMNDVGVYWEESDKSKGSRMNGLQLMRDRLEASLRGEGPGLYVTDNCRATIATWPILPRDEDNLDDVDTTAEDHTYDMGRYRVLKGAFSGPTKLETRWPT
jgi:hypothetical protein